jgi:hypothetical protein
MVYCAYNRWTQERVPCAPCDGIGMIDVPFEEPCPFAPGSKEKMAWLAARYHRGHDLWHEADAGNPHDDRDLEPIPVTSGNHKRGTQRPGTAQGRWGVAEED